MEQLKRTWQTEAAAPDLLPYEGLLVDALTAAVKKQVGKRERHTKREREGDSGQ